MHIRNKKTSHILHGGAMLLEAILVVGILMMSIPLIMQQVNRRNEQFENLTISSEVKAIQSAAGGLVIFDKDELLAMMGEVPIVIIHGADMVTRLEKYGLPDSFAINNLMGLTHGVLLHKTPIGDHSDPASEKKFALKGYVISQLETTSDENYIKVNEILNSLGWNAAFIDNEDELISNLPTYNLDPSVRAMIGKNVFVITLEQQQNLGDFMAKDIVNDDPTYNTMMTVLNMNENSISDVQEITGFEITVENLDLDYLRTKDMESNQLTGSTLAFQSNQNVDNAIIDVKKLLVGEMRINDNITANRFKTRGAVEVSEISTKELQVDNVAEIKELGFVKSIKADVLRLYNKDSSAPSDKDKPIYGKDFGVTNAVIIVGDVDAELANPEDDSSSAWINQAARISPSNSSNMVTEIMLTHPSTGGTAKLSEMITEQVRVLKDIMNEAVITWPDFTP